MTLRNADRDSARVTAVMFSLAAARLPEPQVERVQVTGDDAEVCLVGQNGLRARIHLHKEDGHWAVADVHAA